MVIENRCLSQAEMNYVVVCEQWSNGQDQGRCSIEGGTLISSRYCMALSFPRGKHVSVREHGRFQQLVECT
jgi:hypothetical protein